MTKINEILPRKCTKRRYQLIFIYKFMSSNILFLCASLTFIIDCALEKFCTFKYLTERAFKEVISYVFLNISNLDPTRTQSHENVTIDTGVQEIITKTSK